MATCPKCGSTELDADGHCPACTTVFEEEVSEAVLLTEEDEEELALTDDEPITTELGPELVAGQLGQEGPVEVPSITTPSPIEDAHAALQVNVRYEYSAVPADSPPVTGILVGIDAFGKPLVTKDAGPVAHVILALDLSASMDHPEKFPVLKAAVANMLADLRRPGTADVLLSVVIFSRRATVLLKGVRARDVDTEDLFAMIEQNPLCFGNYTDVAGALSHAGRIAYDARRASTVLPIRVYLLTDGKPQDMPQAREVADLLGKVKADMHCLAFGTDADVMHLQELFTGRRGGTIKRIRHETIESAFERLAEVSQKVVSTRCLVDVDLAPGVVGGDAFRYRPARARFHSPAFEGGTRFRVDLGSIETDRSYQLLFEVRPPETDELVTELGRITVTIPGLVKPIVEEVKLSIPRLPEGSLPGDVDTAVRTARDILTALTNQDPKAALRALKLRYKIYEDERRDPALLDLVQRAITLLETEGSLEALSPDEQATLLAHTCTT